jgi:hypothetical protein
MARNSLQFSGELPLFAAKFLTMGRKSEQPLLTLADRLRISREALGYTPTTFARLINSPSSFIHNCESGQRKIGIDKALKLKRATGLTLEWLYDGDTSRLPRDVWDKIEQQLRKENGHGSNHKPQPTQQTQQIQSRQRMTRSGAA